MCAAWPRTLPARGPWSISTCSRASPRHKGTYFQSAWANYDLATPGSLRLVPADSRLPELRADFQQMQEMFTEPPPSFDDILAQLRNIEVRLNTG